MNEIAKVGHNNPPDPIDEALAPFADVLDEAQNWLDGDPVENEDQMKAVDGLLKNMKAARKAVDDARDSVTKPLHEAWKGEIARWKPTQDDLDLQVKGLIAAQDPFKRKLAAEKEAAQKAAWKAANDAQKAADAIAAKASASDIEAQREAQAAQQAAMDTQKAAQAQSKDTVKGMRTVHKYEITDHRAALHDIAANNRDAITAFIETYVAKNFKDKIIAGVKTWTEKESF